MVVESTTLIGVARACAWEIHVYVVFPSHLSFLFTYIYIYINVSHPSLAGAALFCCGRVGVARRGYRTFFMVEKAGCDAAHGEFTFRNGGIGINWFGSYISDRIGILAIGLIIAWVLCN